MNREVMRYCVKKMNGIQRKKFYDLLSRRDGEFCKCCGKLPYEVKLVVDHKDNNSKNNNLEQNLQLLCRQCNYLKNPRRPLDLCVSEGVSEDQNELQTSRRTEPQFRKFVYHELNEREEVPEKDLIFSGAEDVGISSVTAERYLKKMCSSRGICEFSNRVKTTIVRYKRNDIYV